MRDALQMLILIHTTQKDLSFGGKFFIKLHVTKENCTDSKCIGL